MMQYATFSFSGLESLPTELQRNFNLMRDLDTRSQGLIVSSVYMKLWMDQMLDHDSTVEPRLCQHLRAGQKVSTKARCPQWCGVHKARFYCIFICSNHVKNVFHFALIPDLPHMQLFLSEFHLCIVGMCLKILSLSLIFRSVASSGWQSRWIFDWCERHDPREKNWTSQAHLETVQQESRIRGR